MPKYIQFSLKSPLTLQQRKSEYKILRLMDIISGTFSIFPNQLLEKKLSRKWNRDEIRKSIFSLSSLETEQDKRNTCVIGIKL